MDTQVTIACRIVCAMLLAVATSGSLPAIAQASAPQSNTSTPAKSSKAHAYAHGHNKKQSQATATEQISSETTDAPASNSSAAPQVRSQAAQHQSASATSTVHNPAGNNGFIKVNEETLSDSIPNNDPHVSCRFNVEFYNYDYNPGYKARVSFALHSPTTGPGYTLSATGDLSPSIGEDGASGGNDLDAARSYTLSFTGTPHAKQGYHVKMTVHADGSRGADVKHKVFWVKPCQTPQVLSSSTSTGHTLSTSTQADQGIPSSLPSTGTKPYGFMMIVLASVSSYALAFRFQRPQTELS